MLNSALKTKQYSPEKFFLFFPRLFIAPILSVVILALVAGGITDAGIDLANLSQFLIFSFLLGFNVENLTQVIRDVSNHLFSNLVNFQPKEEPQAPSVQPSDISPKEKPTNIIDKYQQNTEKNVKQSVTSMLAEEKAQSKKDV